VGKFNFLSTALLLLNVTVNNETFNFVLFAHLFVCFCLFSLSCSVVYQYSSLNSDQQHQQPPNYDNAQLSAIRKFDEIYQQQHRFMAEQQKQHFVHLQHQNLSFRVASTYSKQNFLRNQETNSFRIPQGDDDDDWHVHNN
jgi:hypothetical protein